MRNTHLIPFWVYFDHKLIIYDVLEAREAYKKVLGVVCLDLGLFRVYFWSILDLFWVYFGFILGLFGVYFGFTLTGDGLRYAEHTFNPVLGLF